MIAIGGDILPTPTNIEDFIEGNIEKLIGNELLNILDEVDFTIFNLEGPLTDSITPISKAGPIISAPTKTTKALKMINPHLFSCANNHIMDHGEPGLKSTMNVLDKSGISYAGIGQTLDEAKKPYIYEKNGRKIGIYCCTDREFSIASQHFAGANPFDPFESFDHIKELNKECDYIIVLYHGGKEYYRYPSPYLQKICRKMADCGADLILCQHSHCIGSKETWNNGTIIYGQGNFLFNHIENEYTRTGLLVKLMFSDHVEIDYIPVVMREGYVRIAKKENSEIIENFFARSEKVADSVYLNKKFADFSQEKIGDYLIGLKGYRYLRALIRVCFGRKLSKTIAHLYSKGSLVMIRNFIECEAHREVILTGLSEMEKCKLGKRRQ